MRFLEPAALWFGLVIPALLLLYFVHFKREPQSWSTLLFWKQIVREMEGDSWWKRLQHDLLLWLQLAAVVFLILSLLTPAIRGAKVTQSDVLLVVDTSASMQAPTKDSTRLGLAKRFAADLISRLPRQSRIAIVSVNSVARSELGWTSDHGKARHVLAGLDTADLPTRLDQALPLAQGLARASQSVTTYLLGDSLSSLPPPGLPANMNFVSFGTSLENTAITGMAVQPDYLHGSPAWNVRLKLVNFSSERKEGRLEFRLNGDLVAAQPVSLPPGGRIMKITRIEGEGELEAYLAVSDSFQMDNHAWAVLNLNSNIPVWVHGFQSRVILRAISALGRYMLVDHDVGNQTIHVVSGPPFPSGNMLILGGTPPPEIGVLESRQKGIMLTDANQAHPVTELLTFEMPVVESAAKIKPSISAVPLLYSGNLPLAYCLEKANRKMIYLAFNPEESSWPRYPSYLIFLDKALSYLSPQLVPPYRQSGSLVRVGEGVEEIADHVGIFGDKKEGRYAVNLFDQEESRLDVSPSQQGGIVLGGSSFVPGWREIWTVPASLALFIILIEWFFYQERRKP